MLVGETHPQHKLKAHKGELSATTTETLTLSKLETVWCNGQLSNRINEGSQAEQHGLKHDVNLIITVHSLTREKLGLSESLFLPDEDSRVNNRSECYVKRQILTDYQACCCAVGLWAQIII